MNGSPETPDYNPFQAPNRDLVDNAHTEADDERIRRTHLNQETSAKAVGGLFALFGVGCVLFLAGLLYLEMSDRAAVQPGLLMLLSGFGMPGLLLGLGLIQLKQSARRPSMILALAGMMVFPFGTVICGYFLFQMSGAKGKMIFSDQYREVINRTPHIKHANDRIDVGLLACCLCGLLLFLVLIAFWAAYRA